MPERAGTPAVVTKVSGITAPQHSWMVVWADTSREPVQVVLFGIDTADDTACPMVQSEGKLVSAYSIDPDFKLSMMST
jgi:hypothetical protein